MSLNAYVVTLFTLQGPLYSPALKVFNLYFNKMVESISHPEQLAYELYSQDMISRRVCYDASESIGLPTYCRASKLVAAVKDQIIVCPSALHVFLMVIRRDPSLIYIADAMSDHYRKCSEEFKYVFVFLNM